MSDIVISAENLGKRYRIQHQQQRQRYVALRDVLADKTKSVARRLWSAARGRRPDVRGQKSAEDFWALRQVSFEVKQGESVGFIGRNGAGKSTLLKILSRITEPTEGRVRIRGRVASLLEVGTGFHPELTGRENVFLNGAILGMTRAEIRRKFDEIVAFAEVEKFLDTPVKRFSSGMYVRLAFAVAAHIEPEILVVDEVLAVGDAQFQKRCLAKMGAVAKAGRTVLFVSHQLNQIRRLTNKCAWLDTGELRMFGSVGETLGAYESNLNSPSEDSRRALVDDHHRTNFLSWDLSSSPKGRRNCLQTAGEFALRLKLRASKQIRNGHHGIALYRNDQLLVWATAATGLNLDPGLHRLVHTFPGLPLRPGSYSWRVSLYDESGLLDDYTCTPELIIDTLPVTHPRDEWAGLLNIPTKFDVERAELGDEGAPTGLGQQKGEQND